MGQCSGPRTVGVAWLERGWADVTLRRPVYPGDEIITTAMPVTKKLAVAARLHAAYERKGHHYHESDCMILGDHGEELMTERHIGIFKVAERI